MVYVPQEKINPIYTKRGVIIVVLLTLFSSIASTLYIQNRFVTKESKILPVTNNADVAKDIQTVPTTVLTPVFESKEEANKDQSISITKISPSKNKLVDSESGISFEYSRDFNVDFKHTNDIKTLIISIDKNNFLEISLGNDLQNSYKALGKEFVKIDLKNGKRVIRIQDNNYISYLEYLDFNENINLPDKEIELAKKYGICSDIFPVESTKNIIIKAQIINSKANVFDDLIKSISEI